VCVVLMLLPEFSKHRAQLAEFLISSLARVTILLNIPRTARAPELCVLVSSWR